MQTLDELDPTADEYVAALHIGQADPPESEYVPARHVTQPNSPLPVETWPVPQAGQTETPTPPPYVPARQAEHAEALASEKNPLEQDWQALLDWAPAIPENLPAEQAVQVRLDAAPATPEYVPEEHWTHWLLLVPPVPTR